jgi:beta-phosphoglucomutase-like phosphatase (HAD superfamily)
MEVFVTREDTVHTKPHPAPYREALRRMNLFPGECLAVEDSSRGLASARSAGVPCAVIPTSLTRAGNFEGACRVLTSAHELVSQVPSPSPPRASAAPRASGSPSKERNSRPCPNPKAT